MFLKFLIISSVLLLLVSTGASFAKENSFKDSNKDSQFQHKAMEKETKRNEFRTMNRFTSETAHKRMKKENLKFVASGKLVSAGKDFMEVQVLKATKNGKDLIGEVRTFYLLPKTKILGSKNLNLFNQGIVSDVYVVLTAYKTEDKLIATRVLIKNPRKVVVNGVVTSLFDGGAYVFVERSNNTGKKFIGKEVRVIFKEFTKFNYPTTLTTSIQVGNFVNILGYEKQGDINALRVTVKSTSTGSFNETTQSIPTDISTTETTGQSLDSTDLPSTSTETSNSYEGSNSLIQSKTMKTLNSLIDELRLYISTLVNLIQKII
ncbi:MAG: hypothetical protein N2440_03650 [Actinobacteria bacterium]|nr:hypothetical protein [Actinomycetota bacterium]